MANKQAVERTRKMPSLYPWQGADWSRLQLSICSERLPHALLLSGAEGIGKRQFAEVLAASLLCQSGANDGTPCGQCRGCELFLAGSHPDLKRIEPEEKGKQIRIDAVRDYVSGESLTAQAGGYKVVILEPAEAMNTAAANSLLKTLEEPADWTVIILISSRPGALPATIRSRCQQFGLSLPAGRVAEQWLSEKTGHADPQLLLALAAGAPLRARQFSDSDLLTLRVKILEQFAAIVDGRQEPVAVAAAWNKLDLSQVLNWYSGWLVDSLRLQIDPESPDLFNPDQRKRLQGIAERIESKRLFGLLEAANRAIDLQGSQLNGQMLLENLLLSIHDESRALG